MKKTELVKAISEEIGLTITASNNICNALFKTIMDTVNSGEEVNITGFGRFSLKTRAARQGRNPKTNELIDIHESKKLYFKPSSKTKACHAHN